MGLMADTLRAEVELSIAERRVLAAGNDLTLARRSLALALGREEGEVSIAEPLTPALFDAPAEDRFHFRGDLAALSLRTEEAELARRQSRAAYLPRAGLKASYALHDEVPFGAEAGSWSLWAGVSWELFDGFSRAHEEARSAAAKRTAEARRQEGVRRARFALEEARLRAGEARLSLESAQRARAAADEGRRLLLQRYEAGLADLSDLLSAQSALERSRFEAIEAESRLILSLGNIRFQSGAFVPALLTGKEITE